MFQDIPTGDSVILQIETDASIITISKVTYIRTELDPITNTAWLCFGFIEDCGREAHGMFPIDEVKSVRWGVRHETEKSTPEPEVAQPATGAGDELP